MAPSVHAKVRNILHSVRRTRPPDNCAYGSVADLDRIPGIILIGAPIRICAVSAIADLRALSGLATLPHTFLMPPGLIVAITVCSMVNAVSRPFFILCLAASNRLIDAFGMAHIVYMVFRNSSSSAHSGQAVLLAHVVSDPVRDNRVLFAIATGHLI